MQSTHKYRPVLEELGSRTLPAITLVSGVLTVYGTGGADGITVWKPTETTIRAEISSTGESRSFAASAVTKILVRCGGSGDSVVLGDGVTLPSELFGGRGRDSLRGGAGSDTIHGGRGYDSIRGRAGNDHLFGDKGNDIIRGGAGDDAIDGGDGLDACRGDLGTDSLISGFDFDNELIAAFSSNQGDGQLDFVDADPAKRKFDVEVSGLSASVAYGVYVDGVSVGSITTNSSGTGRLTTVLDFDSNDDGIPDFPAGFPELHVGSVIQVKLSSGTVVRQATFAVNTAP